MKFCIETVWLDESEQLLKKYPILSKFKTTTENNKIYITIDTIEEITELIEAVHNPVILDYDSFKGWYIEIYDDYRE